MSAEQQLTSLLKLVTTVTLIVFVGALFGTTGYFLGSENIKKQIPEVYYDESQTEQISENDGGEKKPIDPMNEIADWQTYENKELGFEFKYPKDEDIVLSVFTDNILEMNMPMGFNKDNILKDKVALENNDPTVSFGSNMINSYETIDIPGVLGKKFTILRQLEVCNVQFTREALIYKDNYLIRLQWRYDNNDEIINNNSDYFTTDSLSCGNFRIWKDQNNFYRNLVLGETDIISQKWFNDFNQIISTFKFTEGNKEIYKGNSIEIYEGSKIKMGRGFSFEYSTKIWDAAEINLNHKKLDGCIFSPGVLSRNRLVGIISDEDVTLNNYEARKVKIGKDEEVSSIELYFDAEKSIVFSLSLPEEEKDKILCEKDFEEALSTIKFKD